MRESETLSANLCPFGTFHWPSTTLALEGTGGKGNLRPASALSDRTEAIFPKDSVIIDSNTDFYGSWLHSSAPISVFVEVID